MTANPDMWHELDGFLKVAEAIVAELPENDKRFKDRIANLRDGFELGRGKCRIRDTFYARGGKFKPEAFTPENRKMLDDYAAWLAAKGKQYGGAGDYLPPLLPRYYWSGLLHFVNRVRAEFAKADSAAG